MAGKSIGVFAKRDSIEILKAAEQVCDAIQRRGFNVIPDETLAKNSGMLNGIPLRELHADLLVTVGGDGTVLKAAHEIAKAETPILAINMGRRGYLTEVQPSNFEDALDHWMKGEYTLEKQWKVTVKKGDLVLGEGLNEVVIAPAVAGKMLSLSVKWDEKGLLSTRSDGLIVATPTGSTAHAFSAGGSVLESTLDAFSVVFLAPLQPVRSLVVPTAAGLQVLVGNTSPQANIVADGRLETKVEPGSKLDFGKSRNSAVFVRFGDSFLQRSLKRLAFEKEPV